jgi:hypothetical protein
MAVKDSDKEDSSPTIMSQISQICAPGLFNKASTSWLISLHGTRVGTGSPGLSPTLQTGCKHNSTPSVRRFLVWLQSTYDQLTNRDGGRPRCTQRRMASQPSNPNTRGSTPPHCGNSSGTPLVSQRSTYFVGFSCKEEF